MTARPSPKATGRGAGSLVGTVALARLALRRDRIRILAWIAGVVGFVTASAASVPEIYPTAAELQARGEFVRNPVLAIFSGPGYGTDDYTVGAMVANEYLIYGVLAVALMSVFMVIRHTRAEEEAGRTELVRAAVVGRHAALTAALAVATAVNLVIGALTAIALSASLPELSTVGSWFFGLSMAAAGIAFAAVAGVGAQLTEHARGAVGIGVAVLGASFVLRAAGDVGDDRALSWVSPIGWVQSSRAYVDERWWPLLLPIAFALLSTAVAYALANRRDVAAGLIPPRPGPARASRRLASPGGLALRLHVPQLAVWGVALVAFGAVFGSLVGEVEDFLAQAPELREVFGADEGGALTDAFLSIVMLLLSLLATGYALAAASRPRAEETAGRAEPLLATAISRWRWVRGHLAVAMIGGAVVLVGTAAGLGIVAAIQLDDGSVVTAMLGAGLARVPAMWLVVGVSVALFGLAPRATALGWAVLGYAAVVGLLGDALDLPDAARAFSPFHHVPELPGGDVDATGLLVLTAAAAGLVLLGRATLRRRDIHTA